MPNNPLLARFDGQPSLVSPEMHSVFTTCLDQAAQALHRITSASDKPQMADDFWFSEDDWRAWARPYIVKDGVLQIPVKGVLLNNFPYQIEDWATGYEYIWKAFERGQADPNVRGIALVMDSPGGMVAGCFDLVDKMHAQEDRKPVRAYAQESAYSAAYAIASVADTITVSRTGGVGSIGVVTAHLDASAAMDKAGLKITFIHFGKHKVDGNPYQALPDDVKARMQERIDELGEVFVSTVARNRSMEAGAVRGTEALTFTAAQAVSNGLADEIGSLDDAVAAFAVQLSLDEGDDTMSGQKTDPAVDQAAAIETARAEGTAAGHADGVKAGATAERERIGAIVNSDEGKKRPSMAMKMALGDKFASLDADTIVEMLSEMPAESASKPSANNGKSAFETAMESEPNPDLGNPGEGENAKLSRVQGTLALYKGKNAA